MRAEADIAAARDQVSIAEQSLTAERDGKAPLALAEAEAAARDAARELAHANTVSADLRELLTRGFVTRAEVDRADQARQQAHDRDRLASLRLTTLRTFEQPASVQKSQADVTTARKNLSASAESSRARLAQRRAVVALAEGRAAEASLRLARARDAVGLTEVRSTVSGLVVHRELYFGTDKRKPQPGDEVWPNQTLVAIPDPAQLIVHTRVREGDLYKISASQPVSVSVDAYPDLVLPATVSMIGVLAQEDATRSGAKFFPVTVRLATSDPRLRTGMTARVEVELMSVAHATIVPLNAIADEDGATRCVVVTGAGNETRRVTVAGRNELVASIASGLVAGERVLLFDPAAGVTAPVTRR